MDGRSLDTLLFQLIPYQSAAYLDAVELRNAVLRRPLGLELTADQLAQEVADYHVVGIFNSAIIASATLTPYPESVLRMRQVAVAPEVQARRLGSCLVNFAEGLATGLGYHQLMLHARHTAVDFYLKLGYHTRGEPFIEIAMQHWVMAKNLTLLPEKTANPA